MAKEKKKNKVMSIVDALMKGVSDYIDTRYKITKKVEELKQESILLLYSFKKNFFRSLVEAVVLISAVVSLIVGSIMILNRYFYLDFILFFYGLLACLVIIFMLRLEPKKK